jgi:hypothetical protein
MRITHILSAGALLLAMSAVPALASGTRQTTYPAAADRSEPASSVFTDALNGFMSHGWHAVSDMHRKNGEIVATGVNAKDQVHGITWDAGSNTVRVNT